MMQDSEKIACPKCNHGFALTEGISRQTIDRYAEEFEKTLDARRKALETRLAAEAKAQFDVQVRSLQQALASKDGTLERFRSEELALRRRLVELEEANKNRDVDYQRKLDEERRRIDAQYKAQLESAQREAADLKRKLEQGSSAVPGRGRSSSPSRRCCARRSRSTRSCRCRRA